MRLHNIGKNDTQRNNNTKYKYTDTCNIKSAYTKNTFRMVTPAVYLSEYNVIFLFYIT
jgi:hypothetical protein